MNVEIKIEMEMETEIKIKIKLQCIFEKKREIIRIIENRFDNYRIDNYNYSSIDR